MTKSAAHEALHHVYREEPGLISQVLKRCLGINFRASQLTVIDTDLTEILPIDRHPDLCVLAESEDIDKQIIIIEVQGRPDPEKRRVWPYYLAYLHNKYECQVTLLVQTSSKATATWASKPIHVGMDECPSLSVRPLVVSPHNVPASIEVEPGKELDGLAFAVMAVLTHQHSPDVQLMIKRLRPLLEQLGSRALRMCELAYVGMSKSRFLPELEATMKTMTYPFESSLRSEGREEGRKEGRLEQAAAAVMRLLQARGLPAPESVEREVRGCKDLEALENMLVKAATAQRAEDILM